MAKGLGAILAQGKMKADQSGTEGAVECPLCGRPMSLEAGGWFCRSHRDDGGDFRPCISADEVKIRNAFLNDPTERRWVDDWQGATIAAIIEDGQMAVELATVRGGFGRTNLRLWSDENDLPSFCEGKEWVFMEWAHPFSFR